MVFRQLQFAPIASHLICLVVMWTLPSAAQAKKCDGVERSNAKVRAEVLISKILDTYWRGDVEDRIKELQSVVANCDLDMRQFVRGRGTLDYWLKTGWEAEYKFWRKLALEQLPFRLVDGELDSYKHFAQKAGVAPSETKKIENKLRSSLREQCTPIDLRGPALGPVRDQGEFGWCFAYVAADLIGYRIGKRVSATGIALAYRSNGMANSKIQDVMDVLLNRQTESITESVDRGGNTKWAMIDSIRHGLCLEEELPSEDTGYGSLFHTFKLIESIRTKRGRTRNNGSQSRSFCDAGFEITSSAFRGLGLNEFQEIFDSLPSRSLFHQLADRSCSKIVPKEPLNPKAIYLDDNLKEKLESFEAIDRQLNQNNPVGLAYNVNVLTDLHSTGLHGSIIVGRRINEDNGRCEYLVRNSWGRGCRGYRKGLTCEEGNLWIPKNTLVDSSSNVYYIDIE